MGPKGLFQRPSTTCMHASSRRLVKPRAARPSSPLGNGVPAGFPAIRRRPGRADETHNLRWHEGWPNQCSATGQQDGLPEPSSGGVTSWVRSLAIAACVAGLVYVTAKTPAAAGLQKQLMASWLGKSGFVAAVSLVFLSEVGDKTFFIAALLAMRLGKWISFLGTVIALSLTSVLSVGIGVLFNAVPDAFKQTLPVGEYLGVALLFFFGIKSLSSAWYAGKAEDGEEEEDGELADAKKTLQEAEESGKVAGRTTWNALLEVTSLLFVGEWGDRSMLATIALGASQNPYGVATGAIVAHIAAAGLAVICGSLVGKFVSERGVNLMSGGLFIIFGIATLLGLS